MQWNRKTCRMVLTVMIKTCLSGSQTDGKSNQQTHIMKKMTERQMYSERHEATEDTIRRSFSSSVRHQHHKQTKA